MFYNKINSFVQAWNKAKVALSVLNPEVFNKDPATQRLLESLEILKN